MNREEILFGACVHDTFELRVVALGGAWAIQVLLLEESGESLWRYVTSVEYRNGRMTSKIRFYQHRDNAIAEARRLVANAEFRAARGVRSIIRGWGP